MLWEERSLLTRCIINISRSLNGLFTLSIRFFLYPISERNWYRTQCNFHWKLNLNRKRSSVSPPCMLHTTHLFIGIGKKIGLSVWTGRNNIRKPDKNETKISIKNESFNTQLKTYSSFSQNTQSWQCWHNCTFYVSIYLQFFSLCITTDVSKWENSEKWEIRGYIRITFHGYT